MHQDLTFAALLKRARHAGDRKHPNYVSQPKLAHQLGINTSAIAAWETGRSKPTLDHLSATAKALKVSIHTLVTD